MRWTFVMGLSEEHNRMNLNMSIEESFENVKQIVDVCRGKIDVRITFATVFGYYEGEVIDLNLMDHYAEECLKLGISRISIADSAGLADPESVRRVIRRCAETTGHDCLAMHIHDTRGLALANTYAAFSEGVRQFDTALGGLGGCPFLPGASGNVSTEDTVYMFRKMGVETGINPEALIDASVLQHDLVSGRYNCKQLDLALIDRKKAFCNS